ncbi:MAG: hypothetical protein KAR42_10580 [candidate division Zixibacteria bacterium]|nr:hypothetical protein [candidate division Zixibacteria bacterium]
MDVTAYFKSLTLELDALKNRIRNFIDDSHWQTDGEWKESVLRSILTNRLPASVKIGRGFILNGEQVSTQCDVILYNANFPVLFKEGDFVILTKESVLGVIEVKTRINSSNLRQTIRKLAAIGHVIGSQKLLGVFSYETDIENHNRVLNIVQTECDQWEKVISLICLGCSMFVKWWNHYPVERDVVGNLDTESKWQSYKLENMAAGYFLANTIDKVCQGKLHYDSNLWYPEQGKDVHKTGEITFNGHMGLS